MSDAAATVEKPEEKEADHHPYYRPRDAATLILVDRSGATPKVLVGRRHDKVVFQPGKIVFPGGRVDTSDNRVPLAGALPAALEANLIKGSPKITTSRARVDTLPDVPTLTETGVTKYEADIFYGIVAPAKTPEGTLAQLVKMFSNAVKAPDMKAKLGKEGLFQVGMCGAPFGTYMQKLGEDYKRIISESNITAN